jgi:hypothetical protein
MDLIQIALNCILTRVDWAAIATFCVVLVALYPIMRDYRRSKSQARNLRIRIGAKLLMLKPSFNAILMPSDHPNHTPDAEFDGNELREIVRDIDGLMAQTSVLEPDELDQLGMTFLNITAAAKLYGTPTLTKDSVRNVLELIDQTLKLFESHGLTNRDHLQKPWDKQTNNVKETQGAS